MVLVETIARQRGVARTAAARRRRERHTAVTGRLGIGRRSSAPRRFGSMVPVLLFFKL